MSKASFGFPVYIQPVYSSAFLDAEWLQDYPEGEAVAVDDGSNTESRQAIDACLYILVHVPAFAALNDNEDSGEIFSATHWRCQSQEPEIMVLEHGAGKRLSFALNRGFITCTGAYRVFIACREYPCPALLRRLYSTLKLEIADFACTGMRFVDDIASMLGCFAVLGAKFDYFAEPLAAVRFHDNDRLADNRRGDGCRRLLNKSKEQVLWARRSRSPPTVCVAAAPISVLKNAFLAFFNSGLAKMNYANHLELLANDVCSQSGAPSLVHRQPVFQQAAMHAGDLIQ